MEIKCSPRLLGLCNMVPAGRSVADIGTDHGLLPLYLIEQQIVPFAVASDRIQPPIKTLARLVQELGLEEKISVRLGEGLSVLTPGEADTIVIAGMGGMTMLEILEQAPQVLAVAHCLVLQPQRDIPKVRQWLGDHGWQIAKEDLVWDEGRFYEIICAQPGEMVLTPKEAQFGPVLLRQKPPLLLDYLQYQKEEAQRLLAQLTREPEQTAGLKERERELKEQLTQIEEVMACL